MRFIAIIVISVLTITSCSSDSYRCTCTDETGQEVANYELATDDVSTAQFECDQKSIKFGTGDFKGVTCEVDKQEK